MGMDHQDWDRGFNSAVDAKSSRQKKKEGDHRQRATDGGGGTTCVENTSRKVPACAEDSVMHQKYANFKDRLSTFVNWPSSSKQSPTALSKAGLFYLDFCDHCMCHHCGGTLCEWADEDDPIEEHFRLFPNCAFAKKMKEAGLSDQKPVDYRER